MSRDISGSPDGEPQPLDLFVESRTALAIVFGWGLAEATFFFIVPDVMLSVLALRRIRQALRGTLWALGGALLGGTVMYVLASQWPVATRSFLESVPAINRETIASVGYQLEDPGLSSVLTGPAKGIPYKIYASEWGARGGSFLNFILVSVPARLFRFILAALATSLIASLIAPLTLRRVSAELPLLAAFWLAFYIYYFAAFGAEAG